MISLLELNPNFEEDQFFSYEILKFRWKYRDIINIKYKTPETLPSFEDHIKILNSNRYKKLYKVVLSGINVGMGYIDKDDCNGLFFLPDFLKKAIKTVGKNNLKDFLKGKSLAAYVHLELGKINPEITLHYAKVNPNNAASIKALTENGYELVELTFCLPAKDGHALNGKWKPTN